MLFQTQAQVLIEYPVYQNMDQFDWQTFNNNENIQEYINFRNKAFEDLGAKSFIIEGLNIDKLQLLKIEQELGLYKTGIKTGISFEEIGLAEEAIRLHWENINNIENQMQTYAGLMGVEVMSTVPMIGKIEDYYNGVWELYKGDYEVVFNMVEKKDEALYKALGANDEAYAEFISPSVKRYMGKIGGTAQAYFGSLETAYTGKTQFNERDVAKLIKMYLGSLEIYKCFQKNFQNPTGMNQQALMGAIESWHTQQGLLGADSLIETYSYGIGFNPHATVKSLHKFKEAPNEVKIKVGSFFRNVWNDDTFKMGTDQIQKWAHINSLIGLKYMNSLNVEEQKVFNELLEQGIIKLHPNEVTYTFRLP